MVDDSQSDTAKVLAQKSDDRFMLKPRAPDTQFLSITVVLVLLLGARTFFSLTDDSDEGAMMVRSAVVSQAPSSASPRAPASLPVIAQKVDSPLEQLTALDLNCATHTKTAFSVRGNFVQFRGKSCLTDLDVEIVNRSNGYTASVFSRGVGKYQTDLIQLQDGDNEIVIRYRERSGKSTEEVVRVRSTKI